MGAEAASKAVLRERAASSVEGRRAMARPLPAAASAILGLARLAPSRPAPSRLPLLRLRLLPLLWVLLVVLAPSASAQKAENAIGVWLNPENGSNVEFYRCGAGLCGKIVKVNDGQVRDSNNPDPAKRERPIVGLLILEGARQTGDNRWAGTLYNRENGKTYSGSVTVKSKDALELSGCVLAVLCKTVTWKRVN
jgi:uncharacterized protein (DUF2147 family)